MYSSNNSNGDIAEIIVLKNALKQGLIVSIPYGGHTNYDLVLQNQKGHFYTAQVKKSHKHLPSKEHNRSKKYPFVYVVRKDGNISKPYLLGDFDFLIACDIITENCWIIPFVLAASRKRTISLSSPEVSSLKNNWNPLFT